MTVTAIQASAFTHHLHLASPDPERLAAFYARTMEMRAERQGDSWHVRGPGRRLQVSRGEAGKLLHAGFGVRDAEGLAGLKAHAKANGVTVTDHAAPFFQPGAFAVTDPDGNLVVFGIGTAILGPPADPAVPDRDRLDHRAFHAADGEVAEFLAGQRPRRTVPDLVADPSSGDHHQQPADPDQ